MTRGPGALLLRSEVVVRHLAPIRDDAVVSGGLPDGQSLKVDCAKGRCVGRC